MSDLWLRQDWETDTAFDRFSRFYLPQDLPRSAEEAYRRWRQAAGKPKAGKLPGSWTAWGWPKDRPSWPQRAAAFDDHLAARRIAELEARHMPPYEVIALLSDIARGDMGKLADVKGLDSLEKHPYSYLVNNIVERASHNPTSNSTSRSFQLKLEPKLDALDKLARHYGLFNDNITIKLEQELSNILDQLQSSLDTATYQQVLDAIASNSEVSPPETDGT